MLKGILFDLDGTLVDSHSMTFDGFNAAIVAHGGKTLTPQEIMRFFGPGEGEIFARIVGQENAVSAYAHYRRFAEENLASMPLHAGIIELLDLVRSLKIPTSIVTGRSWTTTEMILKHHGLLDRFVAVIANDHVPSPKPSPAGLKLALSRMGVQAETTAYVGDSWVDMRAAKLAGMPAVAALWDLTARHEDLETHAPVLCAAHPRDIAAFIELKTQSDPTKL